MHAPAPAGGLVGDFRKLIHELLDDLDDTFRSGSRGLNGWPDRLRQVDLRTLSPVIWW